MANNIKAENKKTEAKAESTKAATAEKEADAEDAVEEINTDELFKRRESVDLTPKNAWFSASEGGLVSLKVINAEGEEEFFERVVIRRSFPVTAPDEFLSVREPDTRKKGRGAEIGMIRDIKIFDAATEAATGITLMPASFHRGIYLVGIPAPVVTTATFSSATIFATSSTWGLISMIFTPKGLSVSSLATWICSLR